jgi:hypothetical protein
MNDYNIGDIVECVAMSDINYQYAMPKSRLTIKAVDNQKQELHFAGGKRCKFENVIKHWKLQPAYVRAQT